MTIGQDTCRDEIPGLFSRVLVLLVLALAVATTAARGSDEAQRLAGLLDLEEGLCVADVGAGDGEWTEELARRVGGSGRVLATEVEDDALEEIRDRVATAELQNVEVIRGDDRDTGLPAACCDAILLRLVYHHFTDPEAMRESLSRALRPQGRLVVCDIEPQSGWRELPSVPERGGHGISVPQLLREMELSSFSVLESHRRWNGNDDRYCIVFTKP